MGSFDFYLYIGISIALVLFGGVMSGLTVGFMSINKIKLKLLNDPTSKDVNPKDKKRAKRVQPILKNHHLLLVTLLLANSAAMEALPIFLDNVVPSYIAIILSVTFVLAFGEGIILSFLNQASILAAHFLSLSDSSSHLHAQSAGRERSLCLAGPPADHFAVAHFVPHCQAAGLPAGRGGVPVCCLRLSCALCWCPSVNLALFASLISFFCTP